MDEFHGCCMLLRLFVTHQYHYCKNLILLPQYYDFLNVLYLAHNTKRRLLVVVSPVQKTRLPKSSCRNRNGPGALTFPDRSVPHCSVLAVTSRPRFIDPTMPMIPVEFPGQNKTTRAITTTFAFTLPRNWMERPGCVMRVAWDEKFWMSPAKR